MSDQFVGEIKIFAGNFAPTGFAFCDGQILSISQNTALFSLLGTQFGGNGTSNFALPNLQGNAVLNQGQGAGLTPRVMGETGGEANVTLLTEQLPSHTHALQSTASASDTNSPSGALLAEPVANARFTGLYSNAAASGTANAAAVGTTGGSQPHNNLQPYLTLNFIIALQGIFPARG